MTTVGHIKWPGILKFSLTGGTLCFVLHVTSTYLFRFKFEAFNSHSTTTGFLEVLSALELSLPFLIRLLHLFCSAACGVKLLFLRSPGIIFEC